MSKPRSLPAAIASLALAAAAALAFALNATDAFAHHSYSMFDRSKTDTLTGVVKSLDIINPHSWLEVLVTDPQGGQVGYALEMGGPGQIERQGWSHDTLQPGDKVTVKLHPLRDGSHGGQLVSAVLPNGKVMTGGGPPSPAQ
jgi:hypothetical protein